MGVYGSLVPCQCLTPVHSEIDIHLPAFYWWKGLHAPKSVSPLSSQMIADDADASSCLSPGLVQINEWNMERIMEALENQVCVIQFASTVSPLHATVTTCDGTATDRPTGALTPIKRSLTTCDCTATDCPTGALTPIKRSLTTCDCTDTDCPTGALSPIKCSLTTYDHTGTDCPTGASSPTKCILTTCDCTGPDCSTGALFPNTAHV